MGTTERYYSEILWYKKVNGAENDITGGILWVDGKQYHLTDDIKSGDQLSDHHKSLCITKSDSR